ncbi:MAG: hypothetical protein OHK0053_33670 [Microscillaceae bacterium]
MIKKHLIFYFALGLIFTHLWAQEKPETPFSFVPMATQKPAYLRHLPSYGHHSPKSLHSMGFIKNIKDEGYALLVRTAYENVCFHFDHIPFRYAYALLTAPPSYLPLRQASARHLHLGPSPGFQAYFLNPIREEYGRK